MKTSVIIPPQHSQQLTDAITEPAVIPERVKAMSISNSTTPL